MVSPIATIRSARRKIRTHEAAQHADHRRVAEPMELGRDLREHVLADDEHGRTHALAHDDADVADDRRVRHAEHEIGTRAAQRVPQRRSQVREVVHRSTPELGALERRGGHARDAHVVVLDLPRLVLVSVQHPGDDLDLVVLRERLAELRQEVRGRLDTRPVVLVQDEDALAFAAAGHRIRLAPLVRDSLAHRVEKSLDARSVPPVVRELA